MVFRDTVGYAGQEELRLHCAEPLPWVAAVEGGSSRRYGIGVMDIRGAATCVGITGLHASGQNEIHDGCAFSRTNDIGET